MLFKNQSRVDEQYLQEVEARLQDIKDGKDSEKLSIRLVDRIANYDIYELVEEIRLLWAEKAELEANVKFPHSSTVLMEKSWKEVWNDRHPKV